MQYYTKEDYVLLRDKPGVPHSEGELEIWAHNRGEWRPYTMRRQHLRPDQFRPITEEEAEASKAEGGGLSQPAPADGGGAHGARRSVDR